MRYPDINDVKQTFVKNPKEVLWLPTKTRNELIADANFTHKPKLICGGLVYVLNFVSIGGGMWETTLVHLNGEKLK